MKKISRKTLTLGVAIVVVAAFTFAFWPKPVLVDIGQVTSGSMQLTIDEEGYTRVTEQYQVSAPINGHMLRVELEPGDLVEQGITVVARMLPNPLSVKESLQAAAAVQVALSTVEAAKATLQQAESAMILASHRAQRAKLMPKGTVSDDENEQLQQNLESGKASVASAKSMLNVRLAELENARALQLGSLDKYNNIEVVEVKSPISGKVLNVIEKSDKVLLAGAPIMLLGDFNDGIEIVVELLSSDAVSATKNQDVIIKNWQGNRSVTGSIVRIEPRGFIKTSALGVEERRVNVIVKLHDISDIPVNLGHGFRVDVSVVLWQSDQATLVPSSALFRDNGEWSVFTVENGTAKLRKISIEKNNGTHASVLDGLVKGDQVILYPSAELIDGKRVARR